MKKKTLVIAGIAMLAASLQALANEPELGKYPVVFTGEQYTVTMLRIGKDESTVLIKVVGIDNPFDGQIYKHSRICENTPCTTYKYETKEIPGKARWWTIQASRSWGDSEQLSLFPPGIDKKYGIYRNKQPVDFNAKQFYQEYLGQKTLREKK